MPKHLYKNIEGDVYIWIEQGQSICIKAVTSFGDPVELNATEAREIAEKLNEFVAKIDE